MERANVILFNHISPTLSELEKEMIKYIPAGGNWKDIPPTVPSQRLVQIRKSGGRTTYYGRLRNDKPSYTISTYFNRIGNGCFIHPKQKRLISIREAARLQSFRDSFIFYGSRTSQYKQIGNAVPPLLARAIAELIEPHLKHKTIIDLFSGAGGMSEGFRLQGFETVGAIEIDKNFFETFLKNHQQTPIPKGGFILGDIKSVINKQKLINLKTKIKIGVVMGGPPCQGFSTAGWRDPNDRRNELFKEFVEIVKGVRPEFFIMENVTGILSMRKGKAIKEIISCFKQIDYTVYPPMILNAEEFGVPQLRRRVFIIGSLKKLKLVPPRPLFKFKDKTMNLPPAITVGQAISGLPPLEINDGLFENQCAIKLTSKYEEFMQGKLDFTNFYNAISKTA